MTLNLDKEINDIVAPVPTPKTNWLLIIATSLGTVLAVTIFVLWYAHTPAPPPQTLISKPVDMRIKGNPKSMIYHLPGCLSYNNIAPDNIEWFKTDEEAEDAGYRKAMNCPE